MAKSKTQNHTPSIDQNNLISAGGGMLLVKLAENLPDNNSYKSWLIILAPPFTLLLKSIWSEIAGKGIFPFKRKRKEKMRLSAIQQIDTLLNATNRHEFKIKLMGLREKIQMSSITELVKEIEGIDPYH